MIAAPASGAGKTTVTLGLLRALAGSGVAVAPAKVGPDYIDPAFHAAASGRPCRNLDPWAMRPPTLAGEIAALARAGQLVICEGVMGLFDGAGRRARGSTAELARLTGWPVVLVIDAHGQGQSVAALINGFARHRGDVRVAAAIFNKVGNPGHLGLLSQACRRAVPEIALAGGLPATPALALPERHLGLVQAGEHPALDRFLDAAAEAVSRHLDLELLRRLARPARIGGGPRAVPLPPLGQHIAVAGDAAFAFAYEAVLAGWRHAGATISRFSPLADAAPDRSADAVYLPGGYPELHAGRLAGNARFLDGLRHAAARGAALYGECGGYMVLGEELVDADGTRHAMAGLLPLETSFTAPRLHLGYRRAAIADGAGAGPLGADGAAFRGHEFHYARVVREGPGRPLFDCADADGRRLGPAGRIKGRVAGSFVHLIDRADP
ncbi:MAG: cobyrinate a,c-diamide synthase [Kiloniellales bacterium]